MRVLNLYAGLGGNRALWTGCEVTAVERSPEIAEAYSDRFPDDTVVVCDAHSYLEEHYAEFDVVWSSPPCPTHGQYRYNVGVRAKGYKAVYPDMQLYEEILFLMHYFKGNWAVENVKPYYTPLIAPVATLGRHMFWSNRLITAYECGKSDIRSKNKISDYDVGIDISQTKIPNKRQALRNCVDSGLGLHVFNCLKGES